MIELIVNPVSGRGRAMKALAQVEQELKQRGIPHHVSRTACVGDATRLAQAAIDKGAHGIAVLGGDGLLGEVCAALVGTTVALYFVPCGTGNDFIRSLQLPKDPIRALRLQLDLPARHIDCGMVNGQAFINVAGVGFDIEVLRQTEWFKKRMPGIQSYIYGLIAGLRHYRPFQAEVTIDGVTEQGSYTIISMANGRYFGGGMKVSPKSMVDDGLLDVMLVRALPKWKFYCMLPLLMPGLHIYIKSVTRCVTAKRMLIKQDAPFTVELDGELKEVREALFEIRQGGVCVHCP